MRMAYLILAHEAPEQLEHLIDRLVPQGSPDIAIVHADRRSALWRVLAERWPKDSPRLRLVRDPVPVRWGHWSQVSAVARLIAAAADECDFAHLISGADWPVCGREAIVQALSADPQRDCHIEAEENEQEERMQSFRLDARWLRTDPVTNRIAYSACWELRRLSRWIDAVRPALGLERSRPYGAWHKGWTWWSLPADVLQELAVELPRLLASGRLAGTVCADEHVIPSIVASRHPARLAPSRRYVCFPDGVSSPRLLESADGPAIRASGAWFMRKVSLAHDPFFLSFGQPPGHASREIVAVAAK